MPVRKIDGGYQWGKTGKVYPTQAQAERQGRAIYVRLQGNEKKVIGNQLIRLIPYLCDVFLPYRIA